MVFNSGKDNVLDAVPLQTDARVTAVELEPEFARWLAAVGLEEGAIVRVLRRAVFGGPLHIKSSTGAEFAIHRSLARSIRVECLALTNVASAAQGPSVHKADAREVGAAVGADSSSGAPAPTLSRSQSTA